MDYAYGQLLGEGYIESRPCRGYFVCPVEDLLLLDGDMALPGASPEDGPAGGPDRGTGPREGTGQQCGGREAQCRAGTKRSVPGAWLPGCLWTSLPMTST